MNSMFVTNHMIAGAAIGAAINRPIPAFLAGVASHFAMDALPHWGGIPITDERFMKVARTDGLSALAVGAGLTAAAGHRWPSVVAGMAGAVLPDLDKPLTVYVGGHPFPRRWQDFHVRIQNEKMSRWAGEIVFGAVAGTLTLSLLRYASKQRAIR